VNPSATVDRVICWAFKILIARFKGSNGSAECRYVELNHDTERDQMTA
jgi:hypothetical protein